METLRTSSYLIPVKLESEAGKYMLIHGYTGAIDIATENLLKKIQSVASGMDLLPETVEVLLKRGYITTKTQEEEYAYVARMAKALYQKSEILNTNFTFVVTYNCNFRCPYCFERRESKDGAHQIVFTQEMVDKVYNAMDIIQPRKLLRKNVITLYGGEPLLAENKEIVTYIIAEGQKRGYKFSIITNGYDLDSFLDVLSSDNIEEMQITIDGPKEIHNQRRIHYKDIETFNKIIENVRLILPKGITIRVRMNTDNLNVGKFADLKIYFEQIGFYKYPNFHLYSAPLYDSDSVSDTEHEKLDFVTAQTFVTKHKHYHTLSLCNDGGAYYMISQALNNHRAIAFRSIYCLSQAGEYAFDPLGNIYPCWEMVGRKEHLIGSLAGNKIEWKREVLKKWHTSNVDDKGICNHCSYALLCAGNCPAHPKSHCAFFRKLFEAAANRAYVRFKAN